MSERDLVNLVRRNFAAFAAKTFNVVNPGQDLFPNLAFFAICRKLEQVQKGDIKRLLINVPPRSGKSVISSIAFPAFVLGREPWRRVICASYSVELAAKLARDTRTVMLDPSYRTIFPATVIAGKNTETELETTQGGHRYSTSVGGTLTGRGGNFIIIDDPMKPDEAMSQLARDRVWDWFTGTVGSRLDNKAEDAIVVVMQRLHADDLAGRLLDLGGWDHLSIPAIAESEEDVEIAPGRTRTRRIGEVLDRDREPLEVLEQIKRELGSATFEAQYQQQPVPEEGGLLKWAWFVSYDTPPTRAANDRLVISWDTAQKDREVNDYSAAVVALIKPNGQVFVLDVIQERLDFPSLCRRIRDEAQKRRPATTLIESAGSGIPLWQSLHQQIQIIAIQPQGEKVVRFQAVTPMIEAGHVFLPKRAPWLETFKRELLSFPASKNDDQVDAFSQLLNYARRPYNTPLWGRYGQG
jgi:predicted phage terminase large subunit-like protein